MLASPSKIYQSIFYIIFLPATPLVLENILIPLSPTMCHHVLITLKKIAEQCCVGVSNIMTLRQNNCLCQVMCLFPNREQILLMISSIGMT